MKIIAFIFGLVLLGSAESQAQPAPKDLSSLPILSQPLPTGDLISQAPVAAHWSITATLTTSAQAAAAPTTTTPNAAALKPAIFNVTKSDKLYLVESVGPDGKKMVRWKDHQFQATYVSGVANPFIAYSPTYNPDGSVLYYMDFSKSDFPEFSWISASNYVGMAKLGGTAMGLVFKANVKSVGTSFVILSAPHPNPSDAIAVVDLATRRPLMLQVDNELLVYQFTSGSTDVVLPKEVNQSFEAFRKQIHRASIVPPG